MLQIILLFLCIYWILLSVFAFYTVKKIFKYYSLQPNIQKKQIWKALVRSDFGKWNQKKILLGCFTRFPYNFTLLALFLMSFVILLPIFKLFGKKGKQYLLHFVKLIGNFGTRRAYNIIQKQDYTKFKVQTPIIISNHVNWFDIWIIGISLIPVSIVAKSVIKKTPIVGSIGDFCQALYVQRDSTNSAQRNNILEKISERVHKFYMNNKLRENEQKTYPLIIFPQGTTSNGKSILTFKAGAFNDLAPITMFALKYHASQFQMGMGDISQAHHVMISLCLRPTVQVSHRVVQPLKEQNVDQYMKRCRNIMSQMTGYPQIQCGYRDSVEYQNFMLKTRKDLKLD